jgi:uncharacterized protein
MSPTSLIPYEEIVQDALKSVVARVLIQVAREGLPGEHHFYIAFKTRFVGVEIPKYLLDRYPEEMTIVLQYRFDSLIVHDDRFEVKLSFNQRPARIVVPFEAITGFMDPSVNFALQFQVQETDAPITELAATDEQNDSLEVIEADDVPTVDDETRGNVVSFDRFRKKP